MFCISMVSSDNNTITFNGLNRQLSKNVFSRDSAQKLSRLYPKSNGIVGNLPSDWICRIPKNNRNSDIKSLYKILGCYLSIKRFYPNDSKLYDFILTKILRKYNVIPKSSKVTVTKVEKGAYGQGYRISNSEDNNSLFLKLFNDKKEIGEKLTHGCTSEANCKAYVKKKLSSKDKRYFSNFYYADIKNNFYLEEYLPIENRFSSYKSSSEERVWFTKKVESVLKKIGLVHEDLNYGNYFIYRNDGKSIGKCFDLGGIYRIKDS